MARPNQPIPCLKAAVSKRLKEMYPDVKVYDEQIKQHLADENFVLFFAPSENRKVSDVRYQMTGSLDIAYIVRDDKDEAKLKTMFQQKWQEITTGMQNLTYQIATGNVARFRFQNFTQQEADNVLHILCSTTIQYIVEEEDGQ